MAKVKNGQYAEIDRALLNSVYQIINKLEDEVEEYSLKAIPEAYRKNRAVTMETLATILGSKPVLDMVLVDERAIKEIQTIFSESMLDGLNETKKNINKFVKKAVELQKMQQMKTADLAVKIADELKQTGITVFTDKNGKTYNIISYSEMAIRTGATRAVNSSTINASLQLDNDLVKMSYHISSCPMCAMYEGRVYSISGKDKRYPKLSSINKGAMTQYNILHPSCRHRFTVYVEEFDSKSEETRVNSNKPFVDNRSDTQKKAYTDRQKLNIVKQRMRKNKQVIQAYEAVSINKLSEEQKSEYNRLKLQQRLLNKSNKELKRDKK